MRVLIIESEEHFFLTNTHVELLEPLGTVEVILGRGLARGNTSVKDWRAMLEEPTARRVVGLARHRWIFLTSLRRARRSDLVLVQTPPEHGSLLKVLTYLAFCALLGDRTLVVVHSIAAHTASAGPRGRLRARALRRTRGAVFGTDRMRRRYVEAVGWDPALDPPTTTVPVRLTPPDADPVPPRDRGEPLRIGLAGGVTQKRRNFDLLHEALADLSAAERSAVTLVTVGNCTKARCREIMGRFAELVDIDVEEGHLDEDRFLARGRSCHVLVAAMSDGLGYGTTRATGAIGDALRMARTLFVTGAIDPDGEFAGVLVPFSDAGHLTALLRSALERTPTPGPAALAPFTAEGALRRMLSDLRLEHLAPTP